MFVGLTRTKRLRAGRIIALAYLFCVLAPTLSVALPGSQAIAYCLTEGDHVSGLPHVHGEHTAQPVHSQVHDHADAQTGAHLAGDHQAKSVATTDGSSPKNSPNEKCCGLMCVTALPAADISIAKPLLPKAVRASENFQKLRDNAPARLYRPPIT
ncbi:MAG: hypothetical protein J0G33_12685 [Afipia felis]|nr:hypothetical protein [Afipia felis]